MSHKSFEINPECGLRLKDLLKENKMTQVDLAEEADYTEPYISNMINAKANLSPTSAKKFAEILKVRQKYLLCEDNYKTEADFERAEQRKIINNFRNKIIIDNIESIVTTISLNLEAQNYGCSISENDLAEFQQDITDYIQMRTEKWLLPRCNKISNDNSENK